MNLKRLALLVILGGALVACGDDDGGTSSNNNLNHNDNNNDNNYNNNNDNGNSSGLVGEAEIYVSGDQTTTWHYDDEAQSVYCMEDGWLSLDANTGMGSLDDSFSMHIDSFTGPGTYSFNYDTSSSSEFSADVRVGSLYSYNFFYDYSRIDFHYEYSDCEITITSPEVSWYTGTVSCTWFPAKTLSADYEDDPAEFQPHVNVNLTFTCTTGY